MEIITAFIFLFFVNSIIYAQNISTAIRISADYNKTYLIIDDPILTNSTGNIGAYTSIWGFRAGISCDKKVYKAFSMESEIGYSSGGFYGKYFYRKNVNQIYLSITPQYHLGKYINLKGGFMLNHNIKSNDWLTSRVEPFNYGLTGGITGHLGLFELGIRYTHYLNYYYDFQKHNPFFDKGYEYWNITSLFLGFQFWKK